MSTDNKSSNPLLQYLAGEGSDLLEGSVTLTAERATALELYQALTGAYSYRCADESHLRISPVPDLNAGLHILVERGQVLLVANLRLEVLDALVPLLAALEGVGYRAFTNGNPRLALVVRNDWGTHAPTLRALALIGREMFPEVRLQR